jgi:peptidyl-tRNA hydrolase
MNKTILINLKKDKILSKIPELIEAVDFKDTFYKFHVDHNYEQIIIKPNFFMNEMTWHLCDYIKEYNNKDVKIIILKSRLADKIFARLQFNGFTNIEIISRSKFNYRVYHQYK